MVFKLPKWGGAMVHSDSQLTDFIDLKVPRNNVDRIWHKNDLDGEKAGAKGNGIAGNGNIAACTFNGKKDNLVIYGYKGEHLWSSGEMLNLLSVSSSPMVGWDGKKRDCVIACDNKTILMVKKYSDGFWIEWTSSIPQPKKEILLPFSPTIVDEKILILPTKNGPVYAFDVDTGELLGMKKLGSNNSGDYYSTINSACVNSNKNRIYITTEYSKPVDPPRGRLYALDVNLEETDVDEILSEAWFYPFNGRSQASPIFIDDVLYFDGYRPGLSTMSDPRVYALTDDGAKYKACETSYLNKTWFSFSMDPRGGLWYEDLRGKKLVHFKKEDDKIVISEVIHVNKLVKDRILDNYKPLSCMTICDRKNPVMLISVITYFFKKYIFAIELDKIDSEKNNYDDAILWDNKTTDFGINYAGGQYTILKKNNNNSEKNRILFGMYWDGVRAIGSVD